MKMRPRIRVWNQIKFEGVALDPGVLPIESGHVASAVSESGKLVQCCIMHLPIMLPTSKHEAKASLGMRSASTQRNGRTGIGLRKYMHQSTRDVAHQAQTSGSAPREQPIHLRLGIP